jgi:hypothetical protein
LVDFVEDLLEREAYGIISGDGTLNWVRKVDVGVRGEGGLQMVCKFFRGASVVS